jgi:DNA-binding response OmpR family regulator
MTVTAVGTIDVLLVEDEPALRALIRRRLERERCSVVAEADSVAETLELASAHEPDVILLDLLLGGELGSDAVGPLTRLVPSTMIAILTSLPAEIEEPALRRAGAFVFYEKAMLVDLVDHLREDLHTFHRALNGEDVVAPSAIARRR